MTEQDSQTEILFPDISERLARRSKKLEKKIPLAVSGKLTRMAGLTLEAVGIQAVTAGPCLVLPPVGQPVAA